MTPQTALQFAWIGWIISWVIAARWSNRTEKRAASASQFLYAVMEIGGFILLLGMYGGPGGPAAMRNRLWQLPVETEWWLVWIAAAGILFAWWARIYLGKLWSGSVTRKEDHRVVDTGPYRIVRHPIYTGLIVTVIATVLIRATEIALIGGIVLVCGWYLKARVEERFLRTELGDAYATYARRTAMLVPFARL
jgi:protein-S-isoprenylcysteine O-methyltransferase Ste14